MYREDASTVTRAGERVDAAGSRRARGERVDVAGKQAGAWGAQQQLV